MDDGKLEETKMFEETRPAREGYVMEEGMVHGGWQYSSIASGDLRSSMALTPHPARPGLPLNSVSTSSNHTLAEEIPAKPDALRVNISLGLNL